MNEETQPLPMVLVVCADEDKVSEISDHLVKAHQVVLENVLIARTVSQAREMFVGNFERIKIVFVSRVPDTDGDVIERFVREASVSPIWRGLLIAISSDDATLYIAGCKGHFAIHDEPQSFWCVVSQWLQK